MTYRDRIEQALASPAPIDALRGLVSEFSAQGMRRSEIYRTLFEVYKDLQDSCRQADGDTLGDVMDMITGNYVGRNLDLPD